MCPAPENNSQNNQNLTKDDPNHNQQKGTAENIKQDSAELYHSKQNSLIQKDSTPENLETDKALGGHHVNVETDKNDINHTVVDSSLTDSEENRHKNNHITEHDKQDDNPTIVINDSQLKKISLISVFLRSAIYEAKFLFHNRWDFLVLLWLPLLTIVSIWWIFSKPYINDLPIGVIDDSKSSYSRTLTRYLDASPDVEITKLYSSRAQAHEAILDTKIYAVVIIPENFANSINQGQPAPVILKVNAQYGTHSGIIQRGVQSAVGTLSAGVEIGRSVKQGSQLNQAMVSYSPIGVERVSLFNLGGNYQQFLASTVIPALLHILIMIIGATTLGREIRDRTLAIWYYTITNPNTPYPDFKTLKYLAPADRLSNIQANLSFIPNIDSKFNTNDNTSIEIQNQNARKNSNNMSPQFLPHVPHRTSLPALIIGLNGKLIWALLFYSVWGVIMIALASKFSAVSLSSLVVVFMAYVALVMISLWLGAIFSLSSFSLRAGLSTTGFISAPSFAFAGLTFPLLSMSEWAQRWANALPLTHYLKIHLSQLQMSAPISIALPTLYGLVIAVFVSLVISALLCMRAFKNPQRWGGR